MLIYCIFNKYKFYYFLIMNRINKQKNIKRFRNLLNQKPLQEILNIPKKISKNQEISINISSINSKNNEIYLDINLVKYYETIYFDTLPLEINEHIKSFCKDTIDIKILIEYPLIYPYYVPEWVLLICNNNIFKKTKLSIVNYFLEKIKRHNEINKQLYYNCLHPEKDILGFIILINNFDELYKIN